MQNLASALILHSNWDKKAPLFDPFCGSGTILIESMLYKYDVAPTYLLLKMKKVEENLTGMPARIYQHEFDHMQGIVFTEKVSKFKLQFAMKKRDNVVKKVRRQWTQIANQK